MKASTIFLAGSLVANAAFVAVFLAGAGSPSASTPPPASPAISPATAKTPARNDPTAGVDPQMWTHLQTDELHTMLERMRAGGFPNSVIRAIMAEQMRVQFAPRRRVLNETAKPPPYWSPATQDPKIAAELRQIMKEQDKATRDLLGPDPDDVSATMLRRQFPDWPADKLAALRQIQTEFAEKRSDLMTAARGVIASDVMARTNSLDAEMHAALAQVLSPQELEDYDLRLSSTASRLRSKLANFDPSEQEFRTLFPLQQAFDSRFGAMYGPMSQDELRARSEAERQLNEQVHAALGDQRYTDYQRSIDYNYQTAARLVARLELPPQTAGQLYQVQQDFQQRSRQILTDRNLTPQARMEQLGALGAEAETQVSSLLGPRGREAYKTNGGQWLQSIQQMQAVVSRANVTPITATPTLSKP
jgi:hypothetical protein